MKKIYAFLLLTFLLSLNRQANAQFTEDFEGTFLPAGWVTELPGSGNDITQSNSQNHTSGGSYSLRFSSYDYSSDYNQYLFTGAITVQAGVNNKISFWHRKHNTSNEILEWGISTGGQVSTDVTTWTAVTLDDTAWQQTTVDLSPYVGQTIYFAWHYYGNYLYYVYLDDVVNEAGVTCIVPTDLTVTNITETQADLSWTPGNNETAWNIEYGPAGFTQGQGTTTSVSNNSYALSGLSPGTSYDFYVQADCGGGDVSSWTGPFAFFTNCSLITNFPYNYGFENVATNTSANWNTSCWSADPQNTGSYGSPYRWTVTDDRALYYSGPSGAHSGTQYAYTYALNSNDGDEAKLISPLFDMSSLTGATVSFYYHMYGSDMGTLILDTFDGTTWTNDVWSVSGQQQTSQSDPWLIAHVIIPQNTIQFRFRGIRGNGSDSYMAIDDITVEQTPNCSMPTNPTASNVYDHYAELSWVPGGNETAWNIEYGPAGFTQGQGTTINVSSNPYTLTGLASVTSYDYYVQADCGNGDTSFWVGPYNFTTICDIVTSFPYNCDFEDYSIISCWSQEFVSGTNYFSFPNGGANGVPAAAHSGSRNARFKTYSYNGDETKLITPVFDLSGLNNPVLSFWHAQAPRYGNQDELRVYYRISNTAPWILIPGQEYTSAINDWVEEAFIPLPNPSSTYQIAFDGLSDHGNGVVIDDVLIQEVPSCLPPYDLSALNIQSDQADLSWTPRGSETAWNIEYGPAGFTQGQGTTISVSNSTYTLTGLLTNTSYDYYVQADCGSGDTSTWAGPYTFTTICYIVTTFPYNYGFEDGGAASSCWSQSHTFGSVDFVFLNGNSGILNAHSGSYKAQFYSQTNNKRTKLITPEFDLSGLNNPVLSFWHAQPPRSSSYQDELRVYYRVSPNDPWALIPGQEYTSAINDWVEEAFITLPNPSSTYQIAFDAYSHTGRGVLIDDITIQELPTCLTPYDLSVSDIGITQAVLSWTSRGNETAWNIEYGPSGFTQGQGTTISVSSNPYTLTGLSPGTSYDFYVQADCGGGDISSWSWPNTFFTLCYINSFPYNYGFEDGGGTTSCWTQEYVTGTSDYFFQAGAGGYYGIPTTAHSGSYNAMFTVGNNNGDETKLISPVFDLSGLNNPVFSFWHAQGNLSGNQDELRVYYRNSTNDSWTLIPGQEYTSAINDWTEEAFIALPNPSSTYQIAFDALKGNGRRVVIDDITIQEFPSCLYPDDLSASNILSGQADLSWTPRGNETAWNIEYGPAGFTQGQGTSVSGVTNPYTLTGLTSNTFYEYYLQADCGGGDTSAWTGPYAFATTPGCGDTFYDDGGPNNDYSPNLNQTITIYPDNAGEMVTVTFISFNMEIRNDGVMIYDGIDTNAPIFDSGSTYGRTTCPDGAWTGAPGGTYSADGHSFTATNTAGALTLAFTSDYSAQRSGWEVSITCEVPPACPAPSGLSVSNLANNQADLSWTPGDNETSWNIEYGAAGFTQGQGTIVSSVTNPYTLSGLTPDTSYDYYVQANCVGGDTSPWAGPYTFVTLPGCGDTFYDDGGANGNYSANLNYTYVIYPDNQGDVVTVTFNSFDTEQGYDALMVYDGTDTSAPFFDSGSTYNRPTCPNGAWTGGHGDSYTAEGQTFTATNATGALTLVFTSDSLYEHAGWEASITCAPLTFCPVPFGLSVSDIRSNRVDLSWTVGANVTAWNIEYGPTGFNQGQGTTINLSNNLYTLTGLTPSTTYDYYVQADCGGGDTSPWAGPFTFTTACSPITTFPYNNGFEDGGVLTSCWTQEYVSGTTDYVFQDGGVAGHPDSAHSGSYNALLSGGAGKKTKLISPVFDLSGINNPVLSFWHAQEEDNTGYHGNLRVYYRTSGADPWILIPGQEYTNPINAWTLEYIIDLPNPTSGYQIAFEGDTYFGFGIVIDDITVGERPSCLPPTNLSASNIHGGHADLSWTPVNNETAWEIEYGISGFTQGQGTIVNVSSNPYSLDGLNHATNYDYYVRADCGSGDYSIWSGPYTFRTTCEIVTNFPYNYGFENVPSNTGGDWTNFCWSGDPQNTGAGENDAPYRWTVTNGNTVTPIYETGPAGAHTGTQYACTKSENSHLGDQAELISPVFDMSSLNSPQVSFYYYMYGEGGMGTLALDIYDGNTWTNDVWSITGQQQTSETEPWILAIVSIPANTTQFRFRAIRPGSYINVSETAVDDITIMDTPSCPRPTGQSVTNIYTDQVDLSWTPGGNETAWNIEYGPAGFTQGQGTTVNVTDNTYTLSGLQEATYDYYIQADCGGNTSPWTGPFTFTTNCGVVQSFPYEYGFEDMASNDSNEWDNSCWSTEQSENDYFWLVTDNNTPTDLTGPDGAHSGTQYAYTEADPNAGNNHQALLLSPFFDMSSLTEPQVSFYYYMYGSNIGTLSLDTFDGNTWTNSVWQVSGQQQTNGSDLWLQAYVSIPRNTIQFRLRANSSSSYGNHSDIAVDDISVTETASCPMPTGLTASDIQAFQAELSWTPHGNESLWNIEYGPTGFTQGNGTVLNGINNNPYILTGLSPETSYDYYIQADCGGGDTSPWTGPYTFATPAVCPAPFNLSASNIQTNQVELNWTPGDNETVWNIEYGPTGFTQGNGTMLNTTSNTYVLTGLTPAITYDYYVQADCGGGETSHWTGPYLFTTSCTTISIFPYNYGFESDTSSYGGDWTGSCWYADPQNTDSDAISGPYRWTVGYLYSPSYYTGPSNGGHSGTNFAYTEASGSNDGDEALLISPVFDMTSLTNPQVEFYYLMHGANLGTLSLDIYDGSTWTNDVWTISGEQHTSGNEPWGYASILIPQNTRQFRFRAIRGDGDESDIAIDDIAIMEAILCPEPIDLSASNTQTHQIELSWTPGGNEMTWNIEYGTEGFTQGQGTTVSVSTNPYTLTGLSSVTSYDYYVQADCGGGDTSVWSGPYTFTTHPGCGDIFYDDGGPSNVYSSSLNDTYTFYPENTGDVVTVSFDTFNVENSYDGLMIYDGIDTNAPIFDSGSRYNRSTCPNGAWTGFSGTAYAADGESFTATNSYGALTFVFTSDYSVGYSGWKAFITCDPAALSDHKIIGFKFYPNPVNHTLNISAANIIESVKIYNVTGQEVIETKPGSNRTQIDMRRLPNGVYFVKAQINDELTAFKVVKK